MKPANSSGTDLPGATVLTGAAAWTEPATPERPSAIKIFSSPAYSLVRLCMQAGQGLDDHRVPGELIILCVSGLVELGFAATTSTELMTAGDAVHLEPGVVHRVLAQEPSVMLLTVHRAKPVSLELP